MINIAFPRRGEGRFGDSRFGGGRLNLGNFGGGRPVIEFPRGNAGGGRPVLNLPQTGQGRLPIVGRPQSGNSGINPNANRPGGPVIPFPKKEQVGNRPGPITNVPKNAGINPKAGPPVINRPQRRPNVRADQGRKPQGFRAAEPLNTMRGRVLQRIAMTVVLLLGGADAEADMVDTTGVEPWEVCGGCHGLDGAGNRIKFPRLAGQKPDYIVKQSNDFRVGKRGNDGGQMQMMMTELADGDLERIAGWFASQSPGWPSVTL